MALAGVESSEHWQRGEDAIPFLAAPPIAAVHFEPHLAELAGIAAPPPSCRPAIRSVEPGERKVVVLVLAVEAH